MEWDKLQDSGALANCGALGGNRPLTPKDRLAALGNGIASTFDPFVCLKTMAKSMSKKDLTSLLIAFFGGWAIIEILFGVFKGLMESASMIFDMLFGRHDFSISAGLGIVLVPSLAYGLLAWVFIRYNSAFAELLLRFARINKDERIEGIGLAGLLPLMFSMLGLYMMLTHLPSLALDAARWFVAEAQSDNALGGAAMTDRMDELQQNMFYNLMVSALSIFVFRRPDFLERLVQLTQAKCKKVSGAAPPQHGAEL
jgi:hypothetical protein